MWIRLLEMDLGRYLPMLQNQRSLDQACDTGSGFQMAEIGLRRPKITRAPVGSRRPDGGRQRLDFNRITERRRSAVRLNECDTRGPAPLARAPAARGRSAPP